jgi:hypothetical protein
MISQKRAFFRVKIPFVLNGHKDLKYGVAQGVQAFSRLSSTGKSSF